MVRAWSTMMIGVLLLGTACDVDSVSSDAGIEPGQDGSAPNGDATAAAGLTFDFRSEPKIPPHGDGETNDSWSSEILAARIELRDVRAIGDAAPGSGETTAETLTLTWIERDRELLVFGAAPPGIYSLLRAQVVSWQISGVLDTEDQTGVEFLITDVPSMSMSVSVAIEVTLANNDDQIVRIDVELEDVVRDIDWDDVPADDGVLTVDAQHPNIDDIRDNMSDSFDLH